MKNDNGFSLIELMIVVLIIGMLALIGTPAINRVLANHKLKSVAGEITASVHKARSQAVKQNAVTTLVFDTEHNTIDLVYESGGGQRVIPILNMNSSGYGIRFGAKGVSQQNSVIFKKASTDMGDKLTFSPKGFTEGVAGEVYVQNSIGSSYRINITGLAALVKVNKYGS